MASKRAQIFALALTIGLVVIGVRNLAEVDNPSTIKALLHDPEHNDDHHIGVRNLDHPQLEVRRPVAPFAHPTVELSYTEFFERVLVSSLGSHVAAALYDPEMLNAVLRSFLEHDPAKRLLPDEDFSWDMKRMKEYPVTPPMFDSLPSIVLMTKRFLSIAIGRVHRDAELSNLFARSSRRGPAELRAFERALRRVIVSSANYLHTIAQLVIDLVTPSERRRLEEIYATSSHTVDPVISFFAAVRVEHSGADVAALWLKKEDIAAAAVQRLSRVNEPARSAGIFPLSYREKPYEAQFPFEGKFWNMIRPTAWCSNLVRLCEIPDGCRYLCNPEYLLRAGMHAGAASVPHQHRMVGFGSDNKFDWEESVRRMFYTNQRQAHHEIGWFTVFDCTVGVGARAWKPLESLKETPMGFGHASLCLDKARTNTSIRIEDVKGVLLRSEQFYRATRQANPSAGLPISPNASDIQEIARWVVTKEAERGGPRPVGETTEERVEYFDDISFLKLDVEGFEFSAVPKWAYGELENLASNRRESFAHGSRELIHFARDADKYFTVSLLGTEFHRMGHKRLYGASSAGAKRAHFLMLHIASLGFMMVGQEKNPFDYCCYELAWVHYRHFIKSEMWMVLDDV
jgi:hypothetical protein